jgi:hypothetical protein
MTLPPSSLYSTRLFAYPEAIFQDPIDLSVPASELGFDQKAAARGTPLYEDLRQRIRSSAVVHADETSWRSDGLGHFVWFAGNENLAFFIPTGIGRPRWPRPSLE